MKKKYIIFVVILCVLLVAFSVFTGFAPQTVLADEITPIVSSKTVIVTGVANVGAFYLLFSDYSNDNIMLVSNVNATSLASGVWQFNIPSNIVGSEDFYITLIVRDNDRVFYVSRVMYRYGTGPITDMNTGANIWQCCVNIYDDEYVNIWDTLYIDYTATWNIDIYNSLQSQLDETSIQLGIANNTIDTLQQTIDSYEAMDNGVSALERTFGSIGTILNIEILPNITIGTIVAVPLILGVVFLVLRLVRGE